MDPYAEARAQMVREQIEQRGVREPRVLDAMREVPRHLFAAQTDPHRAYDDCSWPIGLGQTISQPYMVALMTDALHVDERSHVLEVGTGSGYQAAVLGRLAGDVVSIERHAPLAAQAAERLAAQGYDNVRVVVGDGSLGWPAEAPYDGIVVTAGAPVVPEALRAQLADGGRLVIPIGNEYLQHLLVITREGDAFHERLLTSCVFVPLVGEQGWPQDLR